MECLKLRSALLKRGLVLSKSKSIGSKFEALVKKSCIEQGVDFTRFRDAGWTGETTTRRFTIKNICDCLFLFEQCAVFIEIKTRKKSIRFDEITQLDDLGKKWKPDEHIYSGIIAKLNERSFFLSYSDLICMQSEIEKKSFNDKDADIYGMEMPTFIPPRARTNRFDIQKMIRRIKS